MKTNRSPPPEGSNDSVAELWALHRRRLLDMGYRMLGSVVDAEDVTAEAYSRLVAANLDDIDDPVGWLVTVTARLSVDRLRSAETRKRAYRGPWLPEPLVDIADAGSSDPADRVTLDDSVRMALLVVLEQLSPAERTSFVLHDIFGISFGEVADIVGRSPAACRQLASRARRRVRSDSERQPKAVSASEIEAVAQRFAHACSAGEVQPLMELLDPGAIGNFDSGGTIPGAPLRGLDGAEPIARVLVRSFRGRGFSFSVADINGEPGVIARHDSRLVAVISLGICEGRVDLIHAIGNPAKLKHLH